MSNANYQEIVKRAQDLASLKSTLALLEWDQQTYLPAQAGAFRAQQCTTLAGLIHQRETDPALGDLLNSLIDSTDLNPRESSNVREMKRQYEKKCKLSRELVEALAKATSTGQQVWTEAKTQADFRVFEASLKAIFDLKREEADAIGHQGCRYDALIDEFEPGAKTEVVESVLKGLCDEIVPLVKAIGQSEKRPNSELVRRSFPVDAQQKISREVSEAIGFDFECGRIDVTAHPFCTTLGPRDVRLTTRYLENYFNSAFFGTLHESGHGIYEQGLNQAEFGLPSGSYCSLGIHESQSRLWENLVGRSEGFWRYFFPEVQKSFSNSLGKVEGGDFYQAINASAPSLIRVEADEATYDLHIIIRFELEKLLLDETLAVADLPEAWNEKYVEYLGIRPNNHAEGVLQDIHWSAGLVGYFPTYTLGNIFAAQFFASADEELGDLESQFEKGEFSGLKNWLNRNIHDHGAQFNSEQLVEKVVGEGPSHKNLVNHLKSKFGTIYELSF